MCAVERAWPCLLLSCTLAASLQHCSRLYTWYLASSCARLDACGAAAQTQEQLGKTQQTAQDLDRQNGQMADGLCKLEGQSQSSQQELKQVCLL